MNGVPKRIKYGGNFVWDFRANWPAIFFWNSDVGSKATIAIDAKNYDAFADMAFACPAHLTLAATNVPFSADTLSDFDTINC
jgi:hypothetical protein